MTGSSNFTQLNRELRKHAEELMRRTSVTKFRIGGIGTGKALEIILKAREDQKPGDELR